MSFLRRAVLALGVTGLVTAVLRLRGTTGVPPQTRAGGSCPAPTSAEDPTQNYLRVLGPFHLRLSSLNRASSSAAGPDRRVDDASVKVAVLGAGAVGARVVLARRMAELIADRPGPSTLGAEAITAWGERPPAGFSARRRPGHRSLRILEIDCSKLARSPTRSDSESESESEMPTGALDASEARHADFGR